MGKRLYGPPQGTVQHLKDKSKSTRSPMCSNTKYYVKYEQIALGLASDSLAINLLAGKMYNTQR